MKVVTATVDECEGTPKVWARILFEGKFLPVVFTASSQLDAIAMAQKHWDDGIERQKVLTGRAEKPKPEKQTSTEDTVPVDWDQAFL